MLSAWQSEVGSRESSEPFIVIAHDADGRPLVLLPLVLRVRHGVRIASFMGGKHTTFNMALWDLDFAARGHCGRSRGSVIGSARESRRRRAGADPAAAVLAGSSESACHAAASSASVNDCPVLTMAPGDPPENRISNSFRRRLKGKERKLQVAGLSLSRREHRRRHRAAARLVLPRQADADGRAEAPGCVRRAGRCGFRPQGLSRALCRRNG